MTVSQAFHVDSLGFQAVKEIISGNMYYSKLSDSTVFKIRRGNRYQ